MSRHVNAVHLAPESVGIAYADDATDIRADGLVHQTHTILISRLEPELQAELEDLETAVDRLLAAAIRRWSTTMPISGDELDQRVQAMLDFGDGDDDDEAEGGQE